MAKQYSLDQYRYISNSKKMRKALSILYIKNKMEKQNKYFFIQRKKK